jgi:oxygen-independent coproporphyrinogen-3 oxidase
MMRQDAVGLYLHIPFCEKVCHFCAFFTRGYGEARAAVFVSDLLSEIRLYIRAGILSGREVETVYFGGGTPTTLSAGQLLDILDSCRRTFALKSDAEFTIEAAPSTVDRMMLDALHKEGFSRISFGAQSFHDAELEAVGASHSAEGARCAVRAAREAGFTNVNLDLIYGLPGQSLTRWEANLQAAIDLGPDHLSCYGLTIEEGSKFHRDRERGQLALPDEDAQADMYRRGRGLVEASGFVQYEVSNFARPGYACRHNFGYWTDREWLGLGPSAHSYLDGERRSNVASLEDYHGCVAGGMLPIVERESANEDLRFREALAFGLRTVSGVRLGLLERRYGQSPLERFREPITRLTREGLLVLEGDALRPSAEGIVFADELALAFL